MVTHGNKRVTFGCIAICMIYSRTEVVFLVNLYRERRGKNHLFCIQTPQQEASFVRKLMNTIQVQLDL